MAAQIDPTDTLDDMESEVLYTRAALEADPDASDLLPMTDGWLGMIDGARAKEREARSVVARAAARRRVANARLDDACQGFGDELYLATGKDRSAARWVRFFGSKTTSAFIRQGIREQLASVGAWLGVSGDDVLDRHKEALTTWSTATTAALDLTASTATARGDAHVSREQVAGDLTRGRDGLEATLVERAHERGLERAWPGLFFRSHSHPRAKAQ